MERYLVQPVDEHVEPNERWEGIYKCSNWAQTLRRRGTTWANVDTLSP